MNINNNSRIQWIDLVRALAIIAVVICHAAHGIYQLNLDGVSSLSLASKYFCFTAFSFGRMGVPLFLMITGSLILSKEFDQESIKRFWKHKWLHLLICTLIWFLIYELFLIFYSSGKTDLFRIIRDLMFVDKVNMSHSWYMPMILGMYILLPFVSCILHKYDNKLFIFPLAIYTVFAFGLPLINTILKGLHCEDQLSSQLSLGFSGGAYGLYILYGYFINKGMFKKIRTVVVALITLITFIMAVLLQTWSYKNGVAYNLWYDNLLLMSASLGLFELLSGIRAVPCYSLIRFISYYSFPVYLLHFIFRMILIKPVASVVTSKPLQVIVVSLLSLAISLIVSFAISKIPKAGKYILYLK